MQDLFDMFAGTSTGSILAAALSQAYNATATDETRQPKFWSEAIRNIYIDKRNDIFLKNGAGVATKVFAFLISFVGLCLLFYACGNRKYDSKKKLEAFQSFKLFLIKSKEKLLKEKMNKDGAEISVP